MRAVVLLGIGAVVAQLSALGQSIVERLGEAGLIACGMVLLSPMSSKSHFCVLLLPIAFCCYAYLHHRRSGVQPVSPDVANDQTAA